MKRLTSLMRRQRPAKAPPPAPPAAGDLPRPERPVYVIGDIHGRADLLERILTLIDADIGDTGAADPQLVFVGDYVDHGAHSAEVLARIRELATEFPDNVTCLMGSHDRMMLDFLKAPATRGQRWLRSGGLATMESFGMATGGFGAEVSQDTLLAMAALLKTRLADGVADWLADLPLSWSSGNLWVVHAGADPQHPMTRQSQRVLLWGHPEFDSRARTDGIWVAHGHSMTREPAIAEGRIAVDTGAWQTGRLTACALRGDGSHRFLQT